jgi:hypothetical protein
MAAKLRICVLSFYPLSYVTGSNLSQGPDIPDNLRGPSLFLQINAMIGPKTRQSPF